jgi:hypothetical protein
VTVDIFANLIPPPTPTFTLTANPTLGAIELDIDNGTPGVGEEAAVGNNIWRIDLDRDPDTDVLVAVNQAPDAIFIDRTVASGRNYAYAVEAFTESGATEMSLFDL